MLSNIKTSQTSTVVPKTPSTLIISLCSECIHSILNTYYLRRWVDSCLHIPKLIYKKQTYENIKK